MWSLEGYRPREVEGGALETEVFGYFVHITGDECELRMTSEDRELWHHMVASVVIDDTAP